MPWWALLAANLFTTKSGNSAYKWDRVRDGSRLPREQAGCQVASGPGGIRVPNGSRVGNRVYRPVKFSGRLVCLQILPALALAATEQHLLRYQ